MAAPFARFPAVSSARLARSIAKIAAGLLVFGCHRVTLANQGIANTINVPDNPIVV
jgi:hypothetical protein